MLQMLEGTGKMKRLTSGLLVESLGVYESGKG